MHFASSLNLSLEMESPPVFCSELLQFPSQVGVPCRWRDPVLEQAHLDLILTFHFCCSSVIMALVGSLCTSVCFRTQGGWQTQVCRFLWGSDSNVPGMGLTHEYKKRMRIIFIIVILTTRVTMCASLLRVAGLSVENLKSRLFRYWTSFWPVKFACAWLFHILHCLLSLTISKLTVYFARLFCLRNIAYS